MTVSNLAILNFIFLINFVPATRAENLLTCDGQNNIQQEWLLQFASGSNILLLKEKGASRWSEVYALDFVCGRNVTTANCTHDYFDNVNDPTNPNKSIWDRVTCNQVGSENHLSTGVLDVHLFNGRGKFWCSYRGIQQYQLDLSNCALEVRPK